MNESEIEEILNSFKWIKIKKFNLEEYPTWEEKYKALEKHHLEETNFLIEKIRSIVATLQTKNS